LQLLIREMFSGLAIAGSTVRGCPPTDPCA
jgi:hypothetical protein